MEDKKGINNYIEESDIDSEKEKLEINPRKEAFDKFKLAALSSFETELDALMSGMENEDEIRVGFGIDVCNSITEFGHRITINRHANKEISIRNPKTSEDLELVSEMDESKVDADEKTGPFTA